MSSTARTTDPPPAAPGAGRRRPSPFGPTVPGIVAAVTYGLAALVWVMAGAVLPGGRWLAVHLFTLGVVTNVVVVFSEHFAQTLTHTNVTPARWRPPVLNTGIVLVLVGLTSGTAVATAVGGTVVTGVVTWAWWRLRRMRTGALGARFGWVVRSYERAHGAFVHGAVLGVLLGLGVLQGTWYGAGRIAHLHVNVAGWAGLTLLATLVFFGPTMARTRIVEGADRRAIPALRHGATALTVGVLLLLATGVGGVAAPPLRLAAAVAMAAYAVAVTVVCLPVATAARRAAPSATRWPVIASCAWFVVVAWADVAVIATGRWRLLDAVGIAMLVGVLVQSITATMTYLAPMLRTRHLEHRQRLIARLERGMRLRTAACNLGAALVVVAAIVRGATGSLLSTYGWALIAISILWLLVVAGAGGTGRPAGGALGLSRRNS